MLGDGVVFRLRANPDLIVDANVRPKYVRIARLDRDQNVRIVHHFRARNIT
jgi:hypothetical protein